MVRAALPPDTPALHAMMLALWADFDGDSGDEEAFVWERPDGSLGGFVSYSLRPWAEGCSSQPCPYIEGWWVAEELRGTGVGRALIAAVEGWARAQGHTELGSDVELHNEGSLRAHAALGFEATQAVQFFRKRL